MPRLLEPLLVQTITARFRSLNVVMPAGGLAAMPGITGPLLTPARAIAVPSPATLLVQSPSKSPADAQLQAQVSDELSKYIAGISHAIVVAHDDWRQRAFLKGVTINGVTATGGSVSGPLLSEKLIPTGPTQGLWGNAAALTSAIGNGLASAWREWEQSVRVPGLTWYPSFAAVPAKQAPPTPNVPTALSQLASAQAFLSTDYLSSVITRKFAKTAPYTDPLIKAVADGFSKVVLSWMPTQMVTGVLGRGSAPVFAPPYVPVGPVVGGSIIEAGPHFAS